MLIFYLSPKFFLKASKRFSDEIVNELINEGHQVFTDFDAYKIAKNIIEDTLIDATTAIK